MDVGCLREEPMQQATLARSTPSAHAPREPPPSAAEPDRLAALARAYRRRLRPADAAEELALDELVSGLWRSHQLAALEIALLGRLARGEDPGALPRLETLVRYGNRLERTRRAAELELERLRRAPAELRTAAPAPAAPEPSPPAASEPAPVPAHATPERSAAPASAPRTAAAHATPEPRKAAASPAAGPPPWALPAAPAGRAALLGSGSILAMVAGLEAAGVPAPVLPPGTGTGAASA